MSPPISVFLDFNLPNATTWFYFSWLLAIALFFKFSRLLSMRNWDVVALFLLVPGLLLRQEPAGEQPAAPEAGASEVQGPAATPAPQPASSRILWFAYLGLLCGSAYFFIRCLVDLALVRRPALAPNLTLGGLAWLACALFVCLVVVAVRRPATDTPAKGSVPLDIMETQAESAVKNVVPEEFPPRVWA